MFFGFFFFFPICDFHVETVDWYDSPQSVSFSFIYVYHSKVKKKKKILQLQNIVGLFWFSCSIKVLIKNLLIFSLRFFDRSAGCYFLYQKLCLSVFRFVQYAVSLVEYMPYLVFLLF